LRKSDYKEYHPNPESTNRFLKGWDWVARLMIESDVRELPVYSGEKLVGVNCDSSRGFINFKNSNG
jgi:hypothetical protein